MLAAMIEKLPDSGPFPQADISLAGTLEARIGLEPAVDTLPETVERTEPPPQLRAGGAPGNGIAGITRHICKDD